MRSGIYDTDVVLFRESLRQKNIDNLRMGAILGGSLVPVFWILDWWIIPEHVMLTLVIRLACTVYAAFLLGAIARSRAWIEKHVDFLSLTFTLSMTFSIAVMCWLHNGMESPYYAGISLVIIGTGFLFSWSPKLSIAFCGLTYGFYILPFVAGLYGVNDFSVVFSNQLFLLSTMIVILAAQRHRYQLEEREFYSNLALQRTKGSLEAAVDKLKEMDRLKSEFFSNITHELRTPLTMILSPVESLLDGEMGDFSASQRAYLRPIRRNALKLLKLINDMLDLARIEERFMRIRVQRTDLTELLTEIVEHAGPLAARKDIALVLDIRSTRDDLHLDLEKVERAVINLISNALKFTEQDGEVTLFLEADGDEVTVGVQDSGVGIPAEKQDQIFERFSQADGTVTRRYGGTGIGLALSRELVELHDGRLNVDSAEGKGSLFTITFKAGEAHLRPEVLDRRQARDSSEAARRADDLGPQEWTRQLLEQRDYRFLDIEEVTERRLATREEAASRATKVLVVEDNLEVLRFIHMQLRDEHAVYLGRDGVHGLELALRERPDVIVTDYMMPKMDGLSMLRELRKNKTTADTPVIMLTAKSRVEDRSEAREAGADIYLSKPFSPKELRSAIRGLLERQGRQADVFMREHVRNLEVISAGLAHEIHNPLSYVKNAFVVISEKVESVSSMLERQDMEPSERVEKIQKSLVRMNRMREIARRGIERIEQVVKLVRRYAREGYPEEPTPMVLDAAVRDVGELITAGGDKDVEVTMNLQAGEAAVICVPEEMHQVIRNLWQNAIEAVAHDGQVRVSTRCDNGVAVFEVADNGHGIPRENLPRIFTPFFTSKEPGKGLGLGLAISQHVVTRAGGSIAVESMEGKGTTFRVQLPVSDGQKQAAD